MKSLFKVLSIAIPSLTLVSLPLTSCNKIDGKQVTKQEWEEAFNLVCIPESWNVTLNTSSETTKSGKVVDQATATWSMNPYQLVHYRKSTKAETTNYYKIYNNCYYSVYKKNDQWANAVIGIDLLSAKELEQPALWRVIRDMYDEATYNSRSKSYAITYEISSSRKVSFDVRINSQNKVACINETIESGAAQIDKLTLNFSDYSTTKPTEFPFKDEEVNWNKQELNLSHDEYVSQGFTSMNERLNSWFTVVNDFSLTQIYINGTGGTITDGQLIKDVAIYVDDVRSTCTITKETALAKLHITGLDLKAGQKVQIIWNSTSVTKPNSYALITQMHVK